MGNPVIPTTMPWPEADPMGRQAGGTLVNFVGNNRAKAITFCWEQLLNLTHSIAGCRASVTVVGAKRLLEGEDPSLLCVLLGDMAASAGVGLLGMEVARGVRFTRGWSTRRVTCTTCPVAWHFHTCPRVCMATKLHRGSEA